MQCSSNQCYRKYFEANYYVAQTSATKGALARPWLQKPGATLVFRCNIFHNFCTALLTAEHSKIHIITMFLTHMLPLSFCSMPLGFDRLEIVQERAMY